LPTGTPYGCPAKPAASACVSTFGAYDMSGNLKEWTSTQVQPGAYNVRGGGFDTPSGGLACRFSFVSMDSTFSFANLGFRCCSGPP
jgi:sulfatase modifying factor 1